MELDPKELKKKIDDYFANVTDEQLRKDLQEAGWDIYQNQKEMDPELVLITNEIFWDLL